MTASFNGPKQCPKCGQDIRLTTVVCPKWHGPMGRNIRRYARGKGTTAIVPAEPMFSILTAMYDEGLMARARKPVAA